MSAGVSDKKAPLSAGILPTSVVLPRHERGQFRKQLNRRDKFHPYSPGVEDRVGERRKAPPYSRLPE